MRTLFGLAIASALALAVPSGVAQAQATFTVSGTVFYSTTPLQGVTVELIQGSATDPAIATSTSDAGGAYSFSDVAPGSYWIKRHGPTAEFIVWAASTVEVTDSDIARDYHLLKDISLTSPPSESTPHTLHPVLSWAALPEAASYRLQLNITSDWTLIENTTVFTNSHTVGPELTPGTKYTWQVSAKDSVNNGVGGTQSAFTMTIVSPFTVNSADDVDDGTCDATHCSLREAIDAANANAGTDTIAFAIPAATDPGCNAGTGVCTIQPTSALPTITDPVVIDGYTQPGASQNTNSVASGLGLNTVLKIELDGTNAGAGVDGLRIAAGSSTVRGLVINQFSGDFGHGIELVANDGNVVEGNFLGTNVSGTTSLGNGRSGVNISGSSQENAIGGSAAGARNVISGNGVGVWITSGGGNRVLGNFIGTDASGTADLGNTWDGVILDGSTAGNAIGGSTAGARNVISGNNRYGVHVDGFATASLVQGNFIGTDVNGGAPLGNRLLGVRVLFASDSAIGGMASGEGNIIAFNDGAGVQVHSNTRNGVLGNAIFSNAGLGIDLGGDGVTPNDAGDGDTGANNLQNFPVLTSAVTGGGTITIGGTLDSAASTAFRVELFANTACDPSGHGEGETFLGAATATTDAGGIATFSVGLTKAVAAGQSITATATDPNNNTSEFSACVTAVAAPPVPGVSGPASAALAALLAVAFAWAVRRRRQRALAV